jgi:hypothetical protein
VLGEPFWCLSTVHALRYFKRNWLSHLFIQDIKQPSCAAIDSITCHTYYNESPVQAAKSLTDLGHATSYKGDHAQKIGTLDQLAMD